MGSTAATAAASMTAQQTDCPVFESCGRVPLKPA
jgi:hypothetical protein